MSKNSFNLWYKLKFLKTIHELLDLSNFLGVMESYSQWPLECKEAISLLKLNYYQIDNDPQRTIKEKTPLLLDLLRDAFKIIQCSRLKESNFKSMVEESSIQFR